MNRRQVAFSLLATSLMPSWPALAKDISVKITDGPLKDSTVFVKPARVRVLFNRTLQYNEVSRYCREGCPLDSIIEQTKSYLNATAENTNDELFRYKTTNFCSEGLKVLKARRIIRDFSITMGEINNLPEDIEINKKNLTVRVDLDAFTTALLEFEHG